MRSLISISIAILFMAAAPAFAQVDDLQVDDLDDTAPSIPEPGVLALMGIGALAVLAARRGKK